MTEKNFSLQSFTHSIYLNKPAGEVFDFTVKCGGFEKWFVGEASFISFEGVQRDANDYAERKDSFELKWQIKNFSTKGVVLDVQKNKLFSFTFGSLFNVTITLKNENGKTLFTLTQKYNAGAVHNDFAHINCCVCWVFFITNHKSVIENGIDLRETKADNDELVNI